MKFLICGGRDYMDKEFLFYALDFLHAQIGVDYVVQGEASGADTLAKFWAKARNIPCSNKYRADWNKFGKSAGMIRNTEMLLSEKPDGVVAFPRANGEIGRGTLDMVTKAVEAGLQVWQPHLGRGQF
jgi:hypothetical protein